MQNRSGHSDLNGLRQRASQARWRSKLLLCCLLLCAVPSHAERADRDKPVNLEADQVTVDDQKQVATFVGNVILTQGTLKITGDRMVVQQDADGFKVGTSYGNLASFRQKREGYDEYIEGRAERIEYDSKANKVQMFERANLKKTNDDVRGNYISYDVTTEFFRVTGGGAKAATAANPQGRVRAVIQPQSKQPQPATSAAPLALKPAAEVENPRDTPGTQR